MADSRNVAIVIKIPPLETRHDFFVDDALSRGVTEHALTLGSRLAERHIALILQEMLANSTAALRAAKPSAHDAILYDV